ncbi:MAG: metallophosphoesterase [Clostridia bacterium]|nr:metallophosphoesterase [Clostridia bacterium]
MKKIISLLLVFAMIFAVAACGNTETTVTTAGTNGTTAGTNGTTDGTTASTEGTTSTTEKPTTPTVTEFDEDDVVLTFAAISDIHLEKNKSYDTEAKFSQALSTLLSFSDTRGNLLDAVVIVGDICETSAQIETFKTIYEGMSMPGELLFTLGNHDQESKYSNEALTLQSFKDVLGDTYFQNAENDFATGNRYMVINDAHFLVVQPESYGSAAKGDGVTFAQSSIDWLDAKLKSITEADPNAYVYVFVHAMIENTCYGSELNYPVYGGSNGSYWYTSDLTATLEKYPQVITFSGHLHFPINDERSIMQNKFTSIGTGSVAYLAIENGYSNTASATVPQNAGDVSSGHVVEVDSNGNVRITRLNLATGENFGEPWVLNAPQADGSHLKKYSEEGRAAANKAPEMANVTPTVSVNTIGGSRVAALSFAAGTDDNFVHHYEIKVTNTTDNAVVKDVKWLTDFYLYSDLENMLGTYSVGLGAVTGGKTYKVEVTAVDSWGAKSTTVSATFTVPEDFDGTLPAALVDIDFNADGTATDKMGNATVTLVGGATIENKEVSHNGINKTLAGIHSHAIGDSGTVTLSNYDLTAMSGLYNGAAGFTLEAFYVNRTPSKAASGATSGTQGIFCATEYGGLGMADTGDKGTPGLCLYTASGVYKYTYASAPHSTTDLVHVVMTAVLYDGKFYTAIYVNGELSGSGEFDSTGLWMTDSRYAAFANQLSLCNDIGNAGFPTKDCTIVDAKIYAEALNPEQAKTAYANAKALLN